MFNLVPLLVASFLATGKMTVGTLLDVFVLDRL
jgi:hypothetical protein